MIQAIPSPPASWADFPVGIFTIHTYALLILAGIIVAVVMTSRRLTARGAEPGVIFDIAIGAVPLGLVGARAYHVFTHMNDYFGPTHAWWEPFAIWQGGNAIFGSIIGGAVGIAIVCRITGLRFLSIADALAPGLLFAQAIGRIGNWFNVELYGMPTNLPWGLEVPSTNAAFPAGLAPGTLFSPTFLYELIWDSVGAILILTIERKVSPLRWGRAVAVYFIWYGLGRAWFESIRLDSTEVLFGLRINVWVAFLSILLGIVLFAVSRRRHPGVEDSVYGPRRHWVPAGGGVGSVYTAADFTGDAALRSSGADAGSSTATSGAPARR